MKNWKKFVAGVVVGAVLSFTLAWSYYGNADSIQGKFKLSSLSKINIIKVK